MSDAPYAWWQMHMVGLDVESSGVDPFQDRIVTISTVFVWPSIMTKPRRPKTKTWLVDPGIEVPESAAAVHGWTTERIKAHPNAMEPGVALFEALASLAHPIRTGIPLVLFNAAYDLTMLEAEARRHDVDPLSVRHDKRPPRVVDPFVLDRHFDTFRKGKRRLGDQAAEHSFILAGAHSSSDDALAAVRMVRALCLKYPELAGMSLDELHDAQIKWHAERQASFRAYLKKAGKDASAVDDHWPVRPQPVQQRSLVDV